MRFAFQLFLLASLVFLQVACVRNSNFVEGINCFRAQNYRKAFIYLKPEAQKGQPDAQYAVGYMYYYGQGVVEDRKQAWCWITKAAKVGQPEAVEAVRILKHGPRNPTVDPLDPLIYH